MDDTSNETTKKGAQPPKLLLSDFLNRFQIPDAGVSPHVKTSAKGERTVSKDTPEENSQTSLTLISGTKRSEKKRLTGQSDKPALPSKLPDEIIRPELNIEKHADFIFIPAHSKKVREPRRRTGLLTLPDGSTEEAYLDIQLYKGKTPTTTTRRIYLALQRLWEEKEREGNLLPDGGMVVSTCEIMRSAMFTIAGNNNKLIHEEIKMLRSCPFEWINFFIGNDGKKYQVLSTANILDKYEQVSRKHRKTVEEQYQAAHIVRFGEHILNNLRANKTKPVNYTAVLSIQGEIALVLYTRLDIILANKETYARTSKGLFEDLQIDEYPYPSERKRILEKAIKELDGRCISTGILKPRLERTADGLDWKLVVHKIPVIPFNARTTPVRVPANMSEMIEILGIDIGEAVGEYSQKQRLYETFAIHYPDNFIYQAIAEFRAEGKNAVHKVKFFTAIMHRIAHQRGKEWIKPCPSDCKYRPKKN